MEPAQEDTSLSNPNVMNKYRSAADILNITLPRIVELCLPGADIATICTRADEFLEEGVISIQLRSVYTKKKVSKGIAVPTCINVNNVCAHYSPLDNESSVLTDGDLVKIDVGVHIDGYIATTATTFVIGASAKNPATGRKAQVVRAAYEAFNAALQKCIVRESNYAVTEAMIGIAEKYGCNLMEGNLSHQLKHHVIDGNQAILTKDTIDQHVEPFEFQLNEVYALDVMVSTGKGKPRASEMRTTVYKRALDTTYSLKLKGSRAFFAELNQRFPTLMFTLRAFSDERNARMGVSECTKHNLLDEYPVIIERPGEFVASFKGTVLLTDRGQVLITPIRFNEEVYTLEI